MRMEGHKESYKLLAKVDDQISQGHTEALRATYPEYTN